MVQKKKSVETITGISMRKKTEDNTVPVSKENSDTKYYYFGTNNTKKTNNIKIVTSNYDMAVLYARKAVEKYGGFPVVYRIAPRLYENGREMVMQRTRTSWVLIDGGEIVDQNAVIDQAVNGA